MRYKFSNSYYEEDSSGNKRSFSSSFEVEGTFEEVMIAVDYTHKTDKVIGYNELKTIQFIETGLKKYKKKIGWR